MVRSTREQQAVQDAVPQYAISAEIGRGAFGVVYAARHVQLGRDVAIKQLPRAFAADPSVRERFVAEAQLVASLDHPHIVPVYDFVDRDDGICLIVMERCQGSVGDEFTARGLATDEACAAVLACCAALEEAHGRGLLHRDVKPESLLYDGKGVVKLADFGIARIRTDDVRRTATGTVIGTPAYMSPEQVRGDDLTPASDVYSVGIMAYELLTGTLPFPGASTSTGLLAHHLVTPPTPLLTARPELPHGVAVVVERSLAKAAAERQQSAVAFATELTSACVAAFGDGWLRRRRFVLHWPEVFAISERPAPGAVRTGTIVVRRTEMPAAPPTSPPRSVGAGGTVLVPAAAPLPPPGVPSPTTPAPPAPAPPTVAPTPSAPPARPTPGAPTPGSPRRRLVVAAAAVATVIAIVVGVVALGGGGGGTDGGSAGGDDTTAVDDTTAGDATAATADGGTGVAPVTIVDPAMTAARPPGLDFTVATSAFAPTPCPDDEPLHACIWLAPIIDDPAPGDVAIHYFTSGFVPELEPIGYHLHFYLDTDVDGDELRAGAEVAGGTWKPWDGPTPFAISTGVNGRRGFSLADLEASGARQLCVLVADAEQRVLPGTGNCVPILHQWNPAVAAQQAQRLTGTYHGGCDLGVSLVLPTTWPAVDLLATSTADAAATLRPTASADMQARLDRLVASGGVLWADGATGEPVRSMWVVDVSGDFVLSADPPTVSALLAQLRIAIGTEISRPVVDRTLLVGVDDGAADDGGDLVTYVIPDHGHALLVTFDVPDATDLATLAALDRVVAGVNGC